MGDQDYPIAHPRLQISLEAKQQRELSEEATRSRITPTTIARRYGYTISCAL